MTTASEDKTARVWDATTGQPMTPPLKHDGEVGCAQFSPDDRRLTTVSLDEATHAARVWSWDLAPDSRPVKALLSLAQVLSLHRLDATGTLVPLHAQAASDAWQILRKR